MSNRRIILILTCCPFALQVALIASWHIPIGQGGTAIPVLANLAIAIVVGLIDFGGARYLLQSLQRSENAYATAVAARLEESFHEYRKQALQEEQLAKEIGAHVEAELAKTREALAAGNLALANDHLQASIDAASGSHATHCDNVAIAAVLDSKMRQCADAGVRLNASATIPEDIPMEDIELASIFFNLIDNALHECQALQKEGQEGHTIKVSSFVQAGQLFVKVQNPCRTNSATPKGAPIGQHEASMQHGWGTSIVRSIANEHGGLARFETNANTFVATVMIPLKLAASSTGTS